MKTKAELQKKLNELQKEIDNFVEKEQELEVGKWYKLTKGYLQLKKDMVFQFIDYQHTTKTYALVNHNIYKIEGLKDYNYLAPPSEDLIPATEKEVETALIKEAKKRGFKEGVKYMSLTNNRINKCDGGSFVLGSTFSLHFMGGEIFNKGKWAEIIEDSKPTINGYEMVVNDCCISFGCKVFETSLVFSYATLCKKLHIDSFKIDEHEITVKQLKEIVNYLNK